MRHLAFGLGLGAAISLASSVTRAAPMLAPPGDPAFDQALADLSRGYQREQDVFATRENGLSLDVTILPAEVATVKTFFAQKASDDFKSVTGKHPFAVMQSFDEQGDEGNFSGIATVGAAARLLALRAQGGAADEVAKARDAAVLAARAWHVFGTIGGPGVVARGVRRKTPLVSGDPPLPGTLPVTTPLKDTSGAPQPAQKTPVWRDAVAPGYDAWIWIDDTSKDQVSGYALGAAWLWDALHDDPAADPQVSADLAQDLAAFARALMQVAPELKIDLCLRDADGRLTDFHDLNSRQITPGAVIPEKSGLRNGFNAALALGIIRAAYHTSGDPDIGRYYYDELVGKRGYLRDAASTAGLIFMGPATNYSNVNMLAIALATLGRFESDPATRDLLAPVLETQFWSAGDPHDVSHVKQAWFDVIYGAYAKSPPPEIRARVAENLGGFQPAPAFQRDRINCKDSEIPTGMCTALDGKTVIKIAPGPGHNGSLVAEDIVPMAIRPDSDFEWRSDPHRINGTGSSLMGPGGDFLAAYWLGRLSDGDDTSKNVTPYPRAAPPAAAADAGPDDGAGGAGGEGGAGGSSGDAGAAGAGGETSDAGPDASSGGPAAAPASDGAGGGCGCAVPGRGGEGWLGAGLGLALAAALGSRRRAARQS